ncbi:MAG: ATP-binding cassette domain-containing protein [Microcella sp.]
MTNDQIMPKPPLLEIRDGRKSFGHVAALRGVSLRARQGEVVAVVGDNGAGKSTLVKSLAGVHTLDSGEILVSGQPVDHADPRAARSLGISTVYQDLALVETLDIAANMFLGRPIRKWGVLANRRQMIREAAESLRNLNVRVPSVHVAVGELSGGQRQGVAIARAVREKNPIILMDEPTAALGVRETAQIGEIINSLRMQGNCVILVCHDLEFVFNFADSIHVLRLGRTQGVRATHETNREEIVSLITGAIDDDEEMGRKEK